MLLQHVVSQVECVQSNGNVTALENMYSVFFLTETHSFLHTSGSPTRVFAYFAAVDVI